MNLPKHQNLLKQLFVVLASGSWLWAGSVLAVEPSIRFIFPAQSDGRSFENKITLRELRQKVAPKEIKYFDPLLRKVKVYAAFPIQQVLDAGFGKEWRNSAYSDLELESNTHRDKIQTKTYLLKDEGGYLAFQDMDSLKGWEMIKSIDGTGTQINPGPFYLFWTGVDRTVPDEYPWFFSLTKLKLLKFEEQYPLIVPAGVSPDSDVFRGYTIFRGQCFKCHSINRQGGKVGPDLNAPQSVTAYRPAKMIKDYIRNPSQFRYGNMPEFSHLTDRELEDLLAFFRFKDKNRNF